MRLSRLFLPNYSHEYLPGRRGEEIALHSGLVCKTAAGVYGILPLGLRVLNNIEAIIRKHISRLHAQEIRLPILQPLELWEEGGGSGRLSLFSEKIMRLEAHGRRFCLSPTSEELIVQLLKKSGPLSYNDLPYVLYIMQERFRTGGWAHGIHRAQEFPMHELYGFFGTSDEMEGAGAALVDAYRDALAECEVEYIVEPETVNPGIGHASTNLCAVGNTADKKLDRCPSCGDVRQATCESAGATGDNAACSVCGATCCSYNVISVAQVSKLGTRYSRIFNLTLMNDRNEHELVSMCSGGMSLYRVLVACLERNMDEHGILYPISVAPFRAILVSLGDMSDPGIGESEPIYNDMLAADIDVLWDDRNVYAGHKLAQADSLGIPIRVAVGPRGVKRGKVDIKLRRSGKVIMTAPENVPAVVAGLCADGNHEL